MTVGVLVMAYGTPRDRDDIEAYYTDIRRGRTPPPDLLADLIRRYDAIGGTFPLRAITDAQIAALASALGPSYAVTLGTKHSAPRIEDGVETLVAQGVSRIVGLVLAPHYSRLSVGGYRERLEEALAGRADLVLVESWHDDPAFVEVLAERVRGTGAWVVFTAHSLPERILAEGDPYREQLLDTARLVAERAGLERWSLAFQSASATGERWLGPDVLDELDRLENDGVEAVLAEPIGFVSDHLEILWDLDIEARERAGELGLEWARTASLNDEPAFVKALAAIVRKATTVRSAA